MCSQSREMPINIAVQFNLPFLVMVNDSLAIDDDLHNQYKVSLNGTYVLIRFKKIIREEEGVAIALQDKHGLLTYSQIQVVFNPQALSFYGISANYMKFRNDLIILAVSYINRFLDIYRDVTCRFWIRPIIQEEIRDFKIIALFKNGKSKTYTKGTLGMGTGIGGSAMNQDTDINLRARLANEIPASDERRLQLQALDAMNRQDYFLASLYFAIYFEMVIAIFIRAALLKSSLSDKEIDEAFENKKGEPLSANELLMRHVPKLTGISLDKGSHPLKKDYDRWFKIVRPLRNDMAHGRVVQISKDQTKKCYDIVFGFLTKFKEQLEQKELWS